jgi:hypothetical protein
MSTTHNKKKKEEKEEEEEEVGETKLTTGRERQKTSTLNAFLYFLSTANERDCVRDERKKPESRRSNKEKEWLCS